MPPTRRAHPDRLPSVSHVARYPAMDRLLAQELRDVEDSFIRALSSGATGTFDERWSTLTTRLAGAMEQGWLSEDSIDASRRMTARVVAVARGVVRVSNELSNIQDSARSEARDILAQARLTSTAITPLRRRASVPPPSPSLTPTKKSTLATKRTPSTTSLALSELHGYRPLREWFLAHLAHPWPSASEKQAFLKASPGTTLTFKKIGDWFTNTRRRSGWNAFQKRWARNDKDAIERLVRDLEQPLWAGVHVDPEARAEFGRIQAYFGERERVDEDVRVVVDGMASIPGANVGSGDAFVPADSFLDATPRRPSTYSVGLSGGRVVSGSSDESTQRSVSGSSSLLSYESTSPDILCTPSPLEHPHSAFPPSSYFPPSTYPPSPPGDILVLPPMYPLAESPLTFSTPAPASPSPVHEPNPFFSTLSEHPYALFQNDFWALDLGAGTEYGYGPVSPPRRASE